MKTALLLIALCVAPQSSRAGEFGMGGPAAPAAEQAGAGASAAAPVSGAPARAKRPASAAPAAEAVVGSSGTARSSGIDDIYAGAKLRDPFMKLVGGGAAVQVAAPVSVKEFDPEDLSIHALELKGILRDKAGPMALIFDPGSGMSFILRGGKLYDFKKKAVPGVTGSIKMEQKTVTLMTADKDVQTLRLGETAAEAEE